MMARKKQIDASTSLAVPSNYVDFLDPLKTLEQKLEETTGEQAPLRVAKRAG